MAEHGKLTYLQACEIRARYANGETQGKLSREYGVSQAALSAIVLMKSHKQPPLTLAERRTKELIQKKRQRLLSQYGITLEQLEEMERANGNRCEICQSPPEKSSPHWRTGTHQLYIDHCHSSGKVRGLLCRNCNTAVGLMKDDPNLMQRMIDYVIRHGGKRF